MTLAAVTFSFDPVVTFGTFGVRLETLGQAAVVLIALLAAAILARATPRDPLGRRLHPDDLLSIAVGAAPGAIVGGRVGYALIHLDYYGGHMAALLDPGQGGFELSLAVAGGILTGAYVAWILAAPVGRWADVAALPILLLVAGGKAAMALGGDGQGAPATVAWATSYAGPGPWASLGPAISSHPAQLYEAAATAAAAILLVVVLAAGSVRPRDGRVLVLALGLWQVVRLLVATTWRDPAVLGPLVADQLVSVVLLATLVLGAIVVPRLPRRGRAAGQALAWPDPAVAGAWRRPRRD